MAARVHSTLFAVVGILGISLIYYFLIIHNNINSTQPLLAGIMFLCLSALFLYFLLIQNVKLVQSMQSKLSEQEFIEKNRLKILNFVLDNTTDAIYWFRLNGSIVYVNSTFCKILGYTKEEALALNIRDIDNNFDSIEKVVMTKKQKNNLFESVLVKSNKQTFDAQIGVSHLSDYENDVICAFARDITENKREKQIIQNSLKEKETLLKEIHHRVKNNLQIISSILSLQNRREKNSSIKEVLSKTQSRIYAIAMVHEMVYKSNLLSQVDMHEYIQKLIKSMKEIYDFSEDVEINIDVNKIDIDLHQAVLVATIMHELFLNSYKYAFLDKKYNPKIDIFMYEKGDQVYFGIKDNGRGFDINSIDTNSSLGWKLINTIANSQLNANIKCKSENGFCCEFNFSKKVDKI